MPESEAKKKWTKINTTPVMIKLTNNTDSDVITWLKKQPNRQGAIKKAIREYIANHPET